MRNTYVICVLSFCMFLSTGIALCQPLEIQNPFSIRGEVMENDRGRLVVRDEDGRRWLLRYSIRDDRGVQLSGNQMVSGPPLTVRISGSVDRKLIREGMYVRFENSIDSKAKLVEQVRELKWVDEEGFRPGVKLDEDRPGDSGDTRCVVSGMVVSLSGRKLTLKTARSRIAPKGLLRVTLARDAMVLLESKSLSRLRVGDVLSQAVGVSLSNGDHLLSKLVANLERGTTNTTSTSREPSDDVGADGIPARYRGLSTRPQRPRVERSRHFLVHTDVSERDIRMILDRLERMIGLVSRYYGRPQSGIVECYVVRDITQWSDYPIPSSAVIKIKNDEGITISASMTNSKGRLTKSTVYSCSSPGVVQHEAVHAFCNQTFGSTGPTWYSEGMAEMGQYWSDGNAVEVDQRVINYLRRAKEPKTLSQIVARGQITGDSWEAYAWRWALCHLLANNPNYSSRFRKLGLGLMAKQPGVSFESAYGRVARQLTFEYDQFVRHVDNGYRADLCAWDWKSKVRPVEEGKRLKSEVAANRGWQPAFEVEEGVSYDIVAVGEWSIDVEQLTAKGDDRGAGRLKAAVLVSTEKLALSPEIDIGAKTSFTSPASGVLHLRCNDDWTRLADNRGVLTVHIRRRAP